MQSEILVIDDFLERDLLLSFLDPARSFKRIDEVYYAGDTGFISEDEKNRLSALIRSKLPVKFQDFQCRLRRTRPENQKLAESFIHTDHFAQYSAVIYLTDGQGTNGEPTGTYFWESTLTKSHKMRMEPLAKMYKDLMLVNEMTFNLEYWNCWKKVEQKANRCIVFPSSFYHSPPLMNIEMGERVTLDLFLDPQFDFQYAKRAKK